MKVAASTPQNIVCIKRREFGHSTELPKKATPININSVRAPIFTRNDFSICKKHIWDTSFAHHNSDAATNKRSVGRIERLMNVNTRNRFNRATHGISKTRLYPHQSKVLEELRALD
jgi:hypothetical protein